MEWKLERKLINTGFLIALLILLLLGFFTYRLFESNNINDEWVKHTHLVLETNKELLSNLKDAETGQRGFIITANEAFLEPFYRSDERNKDLLDRLKKLTSDNPEQQARIAEAERLIKEKFAFSRRVIDVRREEGVSPAMLMIGSEEGKRIMDRMRYLFNEIEMEEQRLLSEREAEAGNSEAITKALLIAGMLTSIVLFLMFYFVVHHQIRLRSKKEEELQESHEWFSKTLFSIGDAIITSDRNFIITFMNPVAETLTGWKGKDAIGKPVEHVFNTVHAVTRQKIESPVVAAISSRHISSPEILPVLIKQDKRELYIATTGAPILNSKDEVIGSVLVFRDVTEQKELSDRLAKLNAELEQKVTLKTNELAKNEHRLKLILDNMLEGAQILSTEWRYLYVNNTAVEQSRYTKDELMGATLLEQYPGIENSELFRKLRVCMQERVPKQFEYEFTFRDASKGWFKLTVQPIPEGLFILSMDINERKRREKERKEYTIALEEMLFMTSHKVRQPVSQIMGISNLLEAPLESQEELEKITGFMKDAVKSLDEVTQELTTFIYDLKRRSEV